MEKLQTPRPSRNRPILVLKSSRVNRKWKKVWQHEILRNMFVRVLKFYYAYTRCVFVNPWRLENQEDESSEKEFPTRNSRRKAIKLKQENSEFVLSFRKPEGRGGFYSTHIEVERRPEDRFLPEYQDFDLEDRNFLHISLCFERDCEWMSSDPEKYQEM